jgi:dethiobiotin synthetase
VRRGVFVTGTDTGVGKTVASAALIVALRARGLRVAPMKPIAAGAVEREGRWINEDTELLLAAAGLDASHAGRVTPVLLKAPMAPHLAAREEARGLSLQPIVDAFHALDGDFAVVEGVGGFRVPLFDHVDTSDMARALGLPVVLVVGMRLGCLNHALLTRDAVLATGLRLVGWIANEIDPDMLSLEGNVAALAERLGAPLLGRLPWRPGASAVDHAASLDVGPLL